ncbi:unnamed protein product, partial [Prorocentrum cordatum]
PAWAAPARRRAGVAMCAGGPQDVTDLFGMRSRELKAFLSSKGVAVDDCYDAESLMERAAETQ